MKELFLMRHGKSSWKNVDLDDYFRPLKKRGKEDARFMAEFLADNKLLPDLIFSSSALRTEQTTELVNKVFKLTISGVRFFDSFYLADQQKFIDVLTKLDDSIGSIMIIGHNPTMEVFLASLTGESLRFTTATVAQIELHITNWSELNITKICGKLINLWRPKELKKITKVE